MGLPATEETHKAPCWRAGEVAAEPENPSNRAAAIHTCKHLKHHGYDYQPDQLRHWALAHRWVSEDAKELHDYAEGVLAGTRYHTFPDPIGMHAIHQWREDAARSE